MIDEKKSTDDESGGSCRAVWSFLSICSRADETRVESAKSSLSFTNRKATRTDHKGGMPVKYIAGRNEFAWASRKDFGTGYSKEGTKNKSTHIGTALRGFRRLVSDALVEDGLGILLTAESSISDRDLKYKASIRLVIFLPVSHTTAQRINSTSFHIWISKRIVHTIVFQ